MSSNNKARFVPKNGEFASLSTLRLNEALFLFNHKSYPGAFYLAGYSVECALKARLAKKFRTLDIPDWEVVKEAYVHDLQSLLEQNGLHQKISKLTSRRPALISNWNVITGVDGWSEQSRYNASIGKDEAERLLNAINDPKDGILSWIQKN